MGGLSPLSPFAGYPWGNGPRPLLDRQGETVDYLFVVFRSGDIDIKLLLNSLPDSGEILSFPR